MMMRPIIGLVLLARFSAASLQQPFSTLPYPSDAETDEYQFKWPIQRVAIIGAGPSGLAAYRELTEAGLDVRIFERDNVPGGNWHYTEEIPLDAPAPNAPCVMGDFVPSLPPANVDLPYSEEFTDSGEIRRDHRAPKAVWESLTTITPSPVQQFPQWPWPAGTRWKLSHYQLRNYIRSYASYLNINSNDDNPTTAYNTRVERVEKKTNEHGVEQGWRLWLKSLEQTRNNTYRTTWWTEDFDAVLVASGRFNAPSMPSIPGLDEWVRKFPGLLRHSRQYRRPEEYSNQTVLVVGASASGAEISRDLNHHVKMVYQSVRPGKDSAARFKLHRYMTRIPPNTTIIGEINRFLPIPKGSSIQSGLVELKNGTILSGFDSIIFATGFRYSFPFLPQYYDGATYETRTGSARTVLPFLPLDGSHIRDLYLDMFYIRDPTLAFISIYSGPVQTILLSNYMALALSKVWANMAKLPNNQTMQAVYEKTLKERGGYGKNALYLSSKQFEDEILYFTGWLNEATAKYGGKQIEGLPKYYEEVEYYWQAAHYGTTEAPLSKADEAVLASLTLELESGVTDSGDDDVSSYGDYNDW